MRLKDDTEKLLAWARERFAAEEAERDEAARQREETRLREEAETAEREARLELTRQGLARHGMSRGQAMAEAEWLASPKGQRWQEERMRALAEWDDEDRRWQLQVLAPAQSHEQLRQGRLRSDPEWRRLCAQHEKRRRRRGQALSDLHYEEEAAVAAAVEAVRAEYAEKRQRIGDEIQRQNEQDEAELMALGEEMLRSWGLPPAKPIPAPPRPWWERIKPAPTFHGR